MAAVAAVESAAERDAMAEGLVDLLKPAIKQLDTHVHAVRYFQYRSQSKLGGINLARLARPSGPSRDFLYKHILVLRYCAPLQVLGLVCSLYCSVFP